MLFRFQLTQTKLMQGRLHTEEQRSDHTVRFSVKLLTVSFKTCIRFTELLCQDINHILTATGSKLTPNP